MERTASRRAAPRAIGAFIAGSVGIVGLLNSTVALWAEDTVFDPATAGVIVDEVLARPEVTASLADWVAVEVFTLADVDGVVNGFLPDDLASLSSVIVDSARDAVASRIIVMLRSPSLRERLVDVATEAHRVAIRLFEGEGLASGIAVADGEVRLNLLPLIPLGVDAAQQLGFLTDVDVPELERGNHALQLAQIESVLGRDLPDEFGRVVVYRSDAVEQAGRTLQEAQRVVAVVHRAMVVVLVASGVSLIAAVILARRRPRAVALLATANIAGVLVALAMLELLADRAGRVPSAPGGRAAVDAVLETMAASLQRSLIFLAGVSIVVVVGAAIFLARSPDRGDGSATGRGVPSLTVGRQPASELQTMHPEV